MQGQGVPLFFLQPLVAQELGALGMVVGESVGMEMGLVGLVGLVLEPWLERKQGVLGLRSLWV